MKKVFEKLRLKGMKLTEYLHWRIFGHKMSDTMRKFLGNLSWSFIGGMISAILMFVVKVFAARWLGPSEFGKYNALLSLATAISFWFLLGNNVGTVRYLSDVKYKNRWNGIMTTSLFMTTVQVIVLCVIVFLIQDMFVEKLGIQKSFLILGVFWGVVISYKSIIEGAMRSFLWFRKQNILKISEAVVVTMFFVFLYAIQFSNISYKSYSLSMIVGGIFFIMVGMILLFHKVDRINMQNIKLLFNYNKFVVVASLGGFIVSSEKIVIGKFMGLTNLGLYSAYYMASSLILAVFGGIFMNVFLPSTIQEKKYIAQITHKIHKLFVKGFLWWLVIGLVNVYIVFRLIGTEYSFFGIWAICFVISSYLAFMFSTVISLWNINNIKKASLFVFVINSMMIGSLLLLSNIIYYVIFQILLYMVGYYFVKSNLVRVN